MLLPWKEGPRQDSSVSVGGRVWEGDVSDTEDEHHR